MKKIILFAVIAVVALLSSTQASAQKGYRGFVDVELGAGIETDYSESGFVGGVSTIHGYQSGHSFFGAGIGINALPITDINHTIMVPVFAQYRYDYSLVSKHSFYGKARLGYVVIDGGIFAGVGGGIRFSLNNSHITAVNLGLNLTIQNPEYEDYYYSGWSEHDRYITIIPALTFGIEF